jgi:hypothetical protein
LYISQYFATLCEHCCLLEQPAGAGEAIEQQNQFGREHAVISNTISHITHPLPAQLHYNSELIRVELTPMDYVVRTAIEGRSGMEISRENYSLLGQVISSFAGDLELLKFKSSCADFSSVFEIIPSHPLEHWLTYVFDPAIGFDHWGTLWGFVRQDPQALKATKGVLDSLVDFLTGRRLFFMVFDIQSRLQLREDAILTLTEMSSVHGSWAARERFCGYLVDLATKELNGRKNGKKAQKISELSLSKFLAMATVMKEFAGWCKTMDVDFDPNLDAVKSESAIEPMAFLALYHREFALGLRIADRKTNSLVMVMKNLVETLACDGKTAVITFLNEMGEKLSGNDYSRLAMHLVVAVSEKVRGRKDLAQFITANVKGSALQVQALIKFKFLKEAMAIVGSCDDPNLIEVIYAAAVEAGDREVIRDCRKAFPKKGK